MNNFIYPIKEEYMKIVLEGDLQFKLFITDANVLRSRKTFLDCRNWLEEHIGEIWVDWAWPTMRLPQDPNDPDRWIMMLFKNEDDAIRFKLVWG